MQIVKATCQVILGIWRPIHEDAKFAGVIAKLDDLWAVANQAEIWCVFARNMLKYGVFVPDSQHPQPNSTVRDRQCV
jgi:hypothetical protein